MNKQNAATRHYLPETMSLLGVSSCLYSPLYSEQPLWANAYFEQTLTDLTPGLLIKDAVVN